MYLKKRELIIGLVLFLILNFSCTRQKKLVYLQGIQSKDSITQKTPNQEYLIQPGDVLYIKILSINESLNKLFNLDYNANTNYGYNEANMYIHGYLVNDSGNVTLPIVGDIKVNDKPIEQVQSVIQKNVSEYIKDATTIVKLTSFRITLIGEVAKPGVYYNYDKDLTIFDAIGKAGDLTDYGNRTNVLVVRQNLTGTQSFRLNLLDKSIIQSPCYYIHPNDVIYIEPLKTKAWRMNAPNVSIILSTVTTLVVFLNFIIKF